MSAMIVSRTSTPAQLHATQTEALTRYCHKKGLNVSGIMKIHYSAYKSKYAEKFIKDFERSSGNCMDSFEHIIFWSGDRMCRNIEEFNILINGLREFKDYMIHFVLTNHCIKLSTLLDKPYSRESLQVVHEIIIGERVSSIMSKKMKRSREIRMKHYKRIQEFEKPYYGGKIEYGKSVKTIMRSGKKLKVLVISSYHHQITDLINYMRTKKELDDHHITQLLNSNKIYSKDIVDGKEVNFYWEKRNIQKIPFNRTIRPPIEFRNYLNFKNELEIKKGDYPIFIENRVINRMKYHLMRYRDGIECWIPGNHSIYQECVEC